MYFNLSFSDNEKSDDKSPPHPTSIFVTTINPNSSITEKKKPITSVTTNINKKKHKTKNENIEQEQVKYIPLEKQPQYTFILLITSQGQEVLKSTKFSIHLFKICFFL